MYQNFQKSLRGVSEKLVDDASSFNFFCIVYTHKVAYHYKQNFCVPLRNKKLYSFLSNVCNHDLAHFLSFYYEWKLGAGTIGKKI